MRGLLIEEGSLRLAPDLETPIPAAGEVRVRVRTAGICATDLALARGYLSFAGIPGHEFVGVAETGALAGRRVVGEINAGCGACAWCRDGLARHCPERTVLGIAGRAGAFAETLVLPETNLHPVPDSLSDEEAVFTEPVAAAFEIVEQVDLADFPRALVVGDGRLGLLCAQVLALHGVEVHLAGRHPERQALLPAGIHHRGGLEPLFADGPRWDLVVEATGDSALLVPVLGVLRPRGTLVLKTTSEASVSVDLSLAVIHELRVLGSRCGPFSRAILALADGEIRVREMIEARYALEDAIAAFEHARRSATLKVLIDIP